MDEAGADSELASDPEFVRAVVEQAIDVVTVIDERSDIVFQSPSFEAAFGHSIVDVLGTPVLDLVHEDDRQRVAAAVGRVLSGEDELETQQFRFRHADGRWREIEAAARRLEHRGRRLLLVNTRDVTEREELVRALARRDEMHLRMLMATRNVVSFTDAQTQHLVEVSDEWLRAAGLHREQAIGRTAVELGLWESEAERRRLVEDLEESGGRLRDYEIRIRGAAGLRLLVVNVESVVVGETNMILIVGSDETDNRLLQEQLRKSHTMEALGRLTGGVAHDFNNLLGVVIGTSELLAEAVRGDEALEELVATIREASDRGAQVTRQLLAFSRRQVLDPEPVRLETVVEEMMPLLRTVLGASVRISFETCEGLAPVLVDPDQFHRALLNLVVNARDAMPDGGRLGIEIESEIVTEDAELAPGRYLRITVADTGVGMAPEVLERVFEPFFTTKAPGQGTGLGLSMVFGFARQSDGRAEVQSEPGRGTRISLLLPVASEPAVSRPAAEPPVPAGHGESVLLLEDEPMLRSLVSRLLGSLGYDVTAASDEAEFVAQLEREPGVDLVISDVFLAGPRKGPEIVAERLAERPDVAVLYISGYPADALDAELSSDRGRTLLSKPFTRRRLAEAVRGALRRDA